MPWLKVLEGQPQVSAQLEARPDVRFAGPVYRELRSGVRVFVTDEVVVSVDPALGEESARRLFTQQGLDVLRVSPYAPGQYLLRLSRRVGLFGHLRNLCRCLLYEMGVLPIDVLLREVYTSFEGMRLAELRKAYDEMTLAGGADQAVRELKVVDFPAVVAYDAYGGTILKESQK